MSTEVLHALRNAEIIKVNEGKTITVLDFEQHLNFEVKRIYWVNSKASIERTSQHAHKKLQQIIFCLSGSVEIEVSGHHTNIQTVLTNNGQGLFVPNMHWKRITYLEPSILLCLASESYDADDYIREHAIFQKMLNP